MQGGRQIPPFRLVPEPLTDAAAALPGFRWADPGIGTRQQPEYPDCGACHQRMTFYSQLDSINDDFVIGDVGMVYVFICFDCLTTTSILQFG